MTQPLPPVILNNPNVMLNPTLQANAPSQNPFGESASDTIKLGVQKGIVEGIAAVIAQSIVKIALEAAGSIGSYFKNEHSAKIKIAVFASDCDGLLEPGGEVRKELEALINDKSEREDLRLRSAMEGGKCRENFFKKKKEAEAKKELEAFMEKLASKLPPESKEDQAPLDQ